MNMAVITKRAYNARHIGTLQFTEERFDNKDSGWRLFYGDEDDHVLDRMECFRLISLDEAVSILPTMKSILDQKNYTYYHAAENGTFTESDTFENPDAAPADPFMQAFMKK